MGAKALLSREGPPPASSLGLLEGEEGRKPGSSGAEGFLPEEPQAWPSAGIPADIWDSPG